jgi:ABC-type Fe3+ transport system permease subunit
MTARRLSPGLLAWIGVFGAPTAWTLQHVFGMGLTLAACERAGSTWDIAVNTVTIVLTASAAVVAVLGGGAALLAFRRVRGAEEDDSPPRGRVFFLAIVGLAISPLFLAIILMSGSGVLSLTLCRQS